ncbi:uncharacterized protein LOC142586999 [Dermacentor variabilis]|uniref:uncharacterized protein LOC142586999 n=1 Tax=Dermacentor variabilis TaxID=34621 RepID=UPI003F5B12EF
MVHTDLYDPYHVYECIRYQNDSNNCAVMEFRVVSFKENIPSSSLLSSPSTRSTRKEPGKISVFKWHELQTTTPDAPMTSANDCLIAFSNLSSIPLVRTVYLTGCKRRLKAK